MVDIVKVVHNCPQCGHRLLDINDEYIEFSPCQHYVWYGNLGSIGNDEIWMKGLKMRLLSR